MHGRSGPGFQGSTARAPLDRALRMAHIRAMKKVLLVVVLGGLLIAVFINAFTGFDTKSMTLNGWIALAAGTALSIVVGAGLMALVFYSARRGYDDRINHDIPDHEP